jgi:hypothetical protein
LWIFYRLIRIKQAGVDDLQLKTTLPIPANDVFRYPLAAIDHGIYSDQRKTDQHDIEDTHDDCTEASPVPCVIDAHLAHANDSCHNREDCTEWNGRQLESSPDGMYEVGHGEQKPADDIEDRCAPCNRSDPVFCNRSCQFAIHLRLKIGSYALENQLGTLDPRPFERDS